MKNEILSVTEVSERIARGDVMAIAGAEELLAKLPTGNWIGGTTVYFMTENGGKVVGDSLFCTTYPEANGVSIRHVTTESLPSIPSGYRPNGFSMILIPAFSSAHTEFAINGESYPGLFEQPLFGWITGVHLDDIGARTPKVVDGATVTVHDDGAVLLHVELPVGRNIDLDILNIFRRSDDPSKAFTFDAGGFAAVDAWVEGRKVRLADYIAEKKLDTRLPLVANYAGALVNVAIQSIDEATGEVKFYAPIVPGVEYRLAEPLEDYAEAFSKGTTGAGEGQFSCNCILNYIYGDLEGQKTGTFTGPVTFGEIAYVLLNQTMVRMDIKDAA